MAAPPDSPRHTFRAKRGRDGAPRVQVAVRLPCGAEVTAAGVLLWSRGDGPPLTLLLRERGVLVGDVGGKVEPEDVVRGDPEATLRNTLRREFLEETGSELPCGEPGPLVAQGHSRYALQLRRVPDVRALAERCPDLVAVPADPGCTPELHRAAAALGRALHPRLARVVRQGAKMDTHVAKRDVQQPDEHGPRAP